MSKSIVILGSFDNLRSRDIRFLEEASKLGQITVLVLGDETIREQTGTNPKFPLAERLYVLRALRFVDAAVPLAASSPLTELPEPQQWIGWVWLDNPGPLNEARSRFSQAHGLQYHILAESKLQGFPEQLPTAETSRKKVVVTGCFDWLHSGHVRFFEEVSGYGDLYVIVGHDANIRLLKGEGHPLLPQDERRYMVASVRYVTQALVSSAEGWLDADPEIQNIKPDIYAVNEDGDRGGKRRYCLQRGIEYLVLQRTPAEGLPPRSSTELRGF
jgi:cytidyltransferase-like protein